MEWITLIVLLAVGALVMSKLGSTNAGKTDGHEFHYRQQNKLFSPAERSLYGALRLAVADNAIVFGKVRVADVLTPRNTSSRSHWQKAFNRISAKHFDFVICQPEDLSVIAAIELDDSIHNRINRKKRDSLVDYACATAGLTLHRLPAAANYSVQALREQLFPDSLSLDRQDNTRERGIAG